jgi:hypothetical protein
MTSKTDLRLREIMNEYINERQELLEKRIIEKSMGIFITGSVIGILLAYTSITPLLIGITVGYTIAKRNIPIIDHYLLTHLSLFIDKGKGLIFADKKD